MALRITRKEAAEIQKMNRAASAKLRRIKTKYGVDLPGIQIRRPSTFGSRKELNAYKKLINDFRNRYNQDYQFIKTRNGAVSRAAYNEAKRQIKRLNEKRKKEYNRLRSMTVTTLGEPEEGFTVALRADLRVQERGTLYEQFQPITLDVESFESTERLQHYVEQFLKRSADDWQEDMDQNYKDNYILAIQKNFGKLGDPLVDLLLQMDTRTFIQRVALSDEYGEIATIYSLEDLINEARKLEGFFESLILEQQEDAWED